MKMKNIQIYKRMLAILVAGGISTSLVGCSKSSEKKLIVDPEKTVSNNDEVTTPSMEEVVTTTVPYTEEIMETQTTTTCPIKIDEDGKKGVFVNGDENDYNIYVEGNAYFYGINDEAKIVTEENTQPTVQEIIATTNSPIVTTVPQTTTQEVITTTVPQTTAQEIVTTTVPQTTAQEVITTKVPQTTAQPVTTTVPQPTQVIKQSSELTVEQFLQLAQNLLNELNRLNILKAANTKFTIQDVYATTYIININRFSEETRNSLIQYGYIADDIETILTDSFLVEDAVATHNLTRSKWNTNMDELLFGLGYFKNDPTVYFELIDDESIQIGYNSNSLNRVNTNVTDKLDKVDNDSYYLARNQFYNNTDINTSVAKYWLENTTNPTVIKNYKKSYQFEDFFNYSVAIYDQQAKANVNKSLEIMVDGSLNNDNAYKDLKNLYFYEISNQSGTSLVDCGVGADYAIKMNISTYLYSLTMNEYKSLRGYTHNVDEYKQALTMTKTLAETTMEVNNVVRIHEGCDKQLTK